MHRSVLAVLLSLAVIPFGVLAGPTPFGPTPAWQQAPLELSAAKKEPAKKAKPKAGKGHLGHH